MGNYFEKDAKTAKAKSLGICAFTMDSTGKVLARKYVSWDKDIDKLMPKGKNGKSVDIKNLFFHKFVKTADGRFFGIGEQYHASASGIGIVASFVSHSTLSYVKIVVEDLYIFEFDSDFSLKSLKIFDKPSRNVQMPAITLFDSPRVLAMLMKVHGEFDYKFTQQSKDKSLFNVGYIDFEKTKEDKSSVFNSINYCIMP